MQEANEKVTHKKTTIDDLISILQTEKAKYPPATREIIVVARHGYLSLCVARGKPLFQKPDANQEDGRNLGRSVGSLWFSIAVPEEE